MRHERLCLTGRGDSFCEEQLEFEEKRLCVLIDSKVQRKELNAVRDLAEELFEVDAKAALHKRARSARKYSRLLLKTSMFLLGTLAALILLMVINHRPFLDLTAGIFVLCIILSAVTTNIFIVRHYRRRIRSLAYDYERAKAAFVSRVVGNGKKCKDALRESEEAFLSEQPSRIS